MKRKKKKKNGCGFSARTLYTALTKSLYNTLRVMDHVFEVNRSKKSIDK